MNERILYPIPAGTERTSCFKCRAKIYLVTTGKGHRKAVDCAHPDTSTPSPSKAGEGFAHHCSPTPQRIERR